MSRNRPPSARTPAQAAVVAAWFYGQWGIDFALRYAAKRGATFAQVEAAIEFEASRRSVPTCH